jgi:predicted O-methyltransferase YrrM
MLIDTLNRRLPGFWRLNRVVRMQLTGSPIREPYPRGHFYSPLPDTEQLRSQPDVFATDLDVVPGVDLRIGAQLDLLHALAAYYDACPFIGEADASLRFHLNQGYFLHGDAIALYGLMRHLQPRRIIEVGSGFSSAVMLDTADRFLNHSVELTFIDPYPQRLRSLLCDGDAQRVTIHETSVQALPLEMFDALEAGDVLFVDSSHVSKAGSDVNHLFFKVFPRLRPGVAIHVHDIHWPFEYRRTWVEQGRAWNEAYLLRALLMYSDGFELMLWNDYLAQRHGQTVRALMPHFMTDPGGSCYLRRK